MGLTSSVFVWVLALIAVGVFVWTVIAWPGGAGWWAVARRVGMQLAVVVLVVAALAAGVNRQYDFYSNWADLAASLGGRPPAVEVAQAGAAPSAAAAGHLGVGGSDPAGGSVVAGLGTVDSAASLGLKADPGANGQYRTFQVPGPISGHSGPVSVWFPAGYSSAAQASHRFPVIEAFHGVPGSPMQFSGTEIHLGATLSGEVAAGHLRDAIIVMPNYTPGKVDTECVNGTDGRPRMEDWVTEDVPAWVDSHIRVDRDRGSWVTLGFSAGGWCAGMAALLHPETFAAAIILQGYFQPTFERPYIPFTANSPEGQHYDLAHLARHEPPRVALWLLTSKADPISYGTTKALLSQAKPPLSVTAVVLTNGGHRTSVWLPFVPKTFQWLGSNIPGFAPTH